jgi:signal peptidase I
MTDLELDAGDDARARLRRFCKEWLRPFVVALLVLTPFRSAVADWHDVPTGSMQPTILVGDRIVVDKLAYDVKVPFTSWSLYERAEPQRGDVVVCFSPRDGTRLVKRVIGVPGDSVAMRANRLLINDAPCAYAPQSRSDMPVRDWASYDFARERLDPQDPGHTIMLTPWRRSSDRFGPVTVPAGRYLVLGDNRDDSFDSRGFGFVPRESIAGRAFGVAFSFAPDAWLTPRWSRFFSALR